MHKFHYVLLSLLSLAGCAARLGPAQRLSLDAFIGKPSTDLVAELGPPYALHRRGDLTSLTYISKKDVITPAEPGFVYSGVNVRSTPWLERRQCAFTFRVREGIVDAWSIKGDYCSGMPLPHQGGNSTRLGSAVGLSFEGAGALSGVPQAVRSAQSGVIEKGRYYAE